MTKDRMYLVKVRLRYRSHGFYLSDEQYHAVCAALRLQSRRGGRYRHPDYDGGVQVIARRLNRTEQPCFACTESAIQGIDAYFRYDANAFRAALKMP